MKCTLCNERNGNTRCEGCNTLFCLPCMNKHHDQLVQQFQVLMNIRNEVKETLDINKSLSFNGKQVSCFNEINQWEKEMIQHVQQVAVKTRTEAKEILMKHINDVSNRFEQLTVSMQQQQKEGNYLENDIAQVKNQLGELKNDIEEMNEKIEVDCTMSNSVEWNTLLFVVTKGSSSKSTCESVQTKDKMMQETLKTTQKVTTKTSQTSLIPIHITKINSSLDKSSLIDCNQKPNHSGTCFECQRLIDDSLSMSICSQCEQKQRICTSHLNIHVPSETQNIQSPVYNHSDAAILSPTWDINGSLLIYCSHCKNMNFMNHDVNSVGYYCIVCNNIIPLIHH